MRRVLFLAVTLVAACVGCCCAACGGDDDSGGGKTVTATDGKVTSPRHAT